MNSVVDLEKAKDLLASFTGEARELLKNPARVEELLQKAEAKLREIPAVGSALSRLPLLISMIRAYIRKEYPEVSVKVIVTMVCALLYLLRGKDLIRDSVPVVGYADDIAVLAAAFYFVEPELNAYAQWREQS